MVIFPKKVQNRLDHIKANFGDTYYEDKLGICNLIYDETLDSEGMWHKLDRYAAYRLYYYEPQLLHEEVLGEDKMDQIRLLYDLAIETI